MPRALNLLRGGPNYRAESFNFGLQAAGFEVVDRLDRPEPCDIVVCWNRTNAGAEMAAHVERHGGRALIVENGFFGKTWRGHKWFTVALSQCAGAGEWPDGGPARWDSWGVELRPWRVGREVVVFEQRGIGAPGLASPSGWAQRVAREVGGRIRKHPGANAPAVTLDEDLSSARCCITWHSAAGMQALLLGVPVFFDCPAWIGGEAAQPYSAWGVEPKCSDDDRLRMFRRAAWALWTEEEVRSGAAFAHLLAGT